MGLKFDTKKCSILIGIEGKNIGIEMRVDLYI